MNRLKRIVCMALLVSLLLPIGVQAAGGPAAQETQTALPATPVETTRPEETSPVSEPTESQETSAPLEPTEPEQTAAPTETTAPPETALPETESPTEPDPLEGYTFPDTWSRDALMFAVRYGILEGKGAYNLDPLGKTKRAEMAAMLVRLLGATERTSLAGFTDVSSQAWYYEELSSAVSLGIFRGTTETTLAPNRYITREEAFTVLARAFGLYPQDPQAYTRFRDAGSVSTYARPAISALAELGCVKGYENGKLKPKAQIARQEVASLYYQLLDAICDDPAGLPAQGFVLYRGEQALPKGYRLSGSLIAGAGLSGTQALEDLAVSQRLLLRCATGTELTLASCSAGELSVASSMQVRSDDAYPRLTACGQGASVQVDATDALVYADATLQGRYDTVRVLDGGLRLDGDAGSLAVAKTASGETVTVTGQVGQVLLEGHRVLLTGPGYAETVTVRGRSCTVQLACGEQVNQVDWGLEGLKVAVTGTSSISPSSPRVELTATFTNFTAGYGCVDGARPCTVQWYQDGTLVKTEENFMLREGATASFSKTFPTDIRPKTDPLFTAVITCDDESRRASHTVRVDAYQWDYDTALRTVRGVNVEATVSKNTKLYQDKACRKVLRSVSAGTVLTHLYHSSIQTDPGQVRLADGTTGWMPWSDYRVSRTDYTQYWDYSKATKEGFVNQKGYKSSTGYLIWISLKTQKVNIFQGQKGNWKLIRTCSCATGQNATPTVTGVFQVIYKTSLWRFTEVINGKEVDDYYRVFKVTGFWGGQATHSRLYLTKDGSLLDGTMGTPVSHGCVRMMDEDCGYIYSSIPYNTTVVVY